MMLSVLIPARNEAMGIASCVNGLAQALTNAKVEHEILVVLDHCTDGTAEVLSGLLPVCASLRWVENDSEPGFGFAVRCGLRQYRGDVVAIVMGDASDDPADVVACFRRIEAGAECVFGSRFMKGGRVVDYPIHKYIVNRLANLFVQVLFRLPFADVTNAFKLYRREVIDGIQPLLACHFNLTVEMPLKAIIRGYRYQVLPIRWYNRKSGISKLKLQEMGSRYLFIVLYCWLERALGRGDYRRRCGGAQ